MIICSSEKKKKLTLILILSISGSNFVLLLVCCIFHCCPCNVYKCYSLNLKNIQIWKTDVDEIELVDVENDI